MDLTLLCSYPNHKGLKKNYRHLLKYKQDHPEKFISPKNVDDEDDKEHAGTANESDHDLLMPASMQENLTMSNKNRAISPAKEGSGKMPNPVVSPHPQSRRAQRAQNSLASNIPDEFNQNAEMRSQFILEQLQKELAAQQQEQ